MTRRVVDRPEPRPEPREGPRAGATSDGQTRPDRAADDDATLAVDTERAEAILHDIATELRFVGLRGRAADLHVRALALKREVARWTEAPIVEARRQTTLDELLRLHEEAKRERAKRER